MSDEPQPGATPWPFGAGFDLGAMMRMLRTEGPLNWDVAAQVAAFTADADPATGQALPDDRVDPGERAQVEDLVRAAQTQVAEATGIAGTHTLAVEVVTRRAWADATLRGLRPVLEALATRLQGPLSGVDLPPLPANPFLALGDDDALAGLLAAMAPTLLGVQAGSMIGLLAQRALGQYDLPLPVDSDPAVRLVLANVDGFAGEWSLPRADVRFAVALREVVHGAQRVVPWVQRRLLRLARTYVEGYALDEIELPGALGDLDPTDPASLGEAFADPTALLGAIRTPAQDATLAELQRLVAVLEGAVDAVVAGVGGRLVTDFHRIDEALRRHRLEQGRATAFVERLLGLELRREHYEAGHAFCAGVVERAGPDGLERLWEHEAMLPTPAELEAPGLWLARIELPTDPSS